MPSEGENDHEKPIALCKRKGIRGYDADPDVRRRSCAISGNNTLGSLTGLIERKSRFRAPPQVRSGPNPVVEIAAGKLGVLRLKGHTGRIHTPTTIAKAGNITKDIGIARTMTTAIGATMVMVGAIEIMTTASMNVTI